MNDTVIAFVFLILLLYRELLIQSYHCVSQGPFTGQTYMVLLPDNELPRCRLSSVFFSVAVGLKWNLSIKWERLKVPSFSAIRKGPTCLRRQRLVWESKAFSDPYLGRAGRLELFSLNIFLLYILLFGFLLVYSYSVSFVSLSLPKTLTCPKIVDWLSLTCHWDVLINHLIRYSASFEAASLFRKIGFPVKFSLLTRRPGNNVK